MPLCVKRILSPEHRSQYSELRRVATGKLLDQCIVVDTLLDRQSNIVFKGAYSLP